MTASRQAAAQAHQWSVENLELEVEILTPKATLSADDSSFIVKEGLTLEGASWKDNALSLSNEIATSLPPTKFTWKFKSPDANVPDPKSKTSTNRVQLPVYLNDTRAEFLFSVELDSPRDMKANSWYQRGVALTVWRSSV